MRSRVAVWRSTSRSHPRLVASSTSCCSTATRAPTICLASLCAVLLAEACNVGLEPLVRPEIAALTRARLAWIQHNYLRADTITTANARLVDVHAALPLTKALGAAELASADGLRFVVPVRSVKLRLATASMGQPDTKVSELSAELGITRQTLYRHVSPNGELRPDGLKRLAAKGRKTP